MSNYDVLDRDQYKCKYCNTPSMEVHHILYKSHFGKSQRKLQEALSNKITVCKKCHDALHKGKLIVLYLKNDPELPIITTEKKKDSILDRVDRFIIGGVEYSCN